MLKSYRRRAFLLLALTALESGVATTARADDGPTLWDVLSRTETPNAEISGVAYSAQHGAPVAVTVRRPLGPVPGVTLAGTEMAVQRKHSGFFGSIGDWFGNLETKTGTKIKATGYSTLSLQEQNISGNPEAFQEDQYIGRGSGGVYTDTDLTVDATLFKWFHYQTRISNSLFKNPNDNRVVMDYKTAKTRVQYGDINVAFQGNSLIDFSRYLHGIEIQDTWTPRFNTTLLYSVTKATTQTIVINGNNSTGPYYVYAGQIVDGSAQVRVDNTVLTPGTDYTLDSFTGQLNFLHNRIVLQSSTIAVSFESLGYTSNQGSIYGGRVEVAPRRGWTVGMTYVAQNSQGSTASQMRTEQFNGYGTPNFYYTSVPIDLTKPLVITVGGQPLSPAAYQVNTTTTTTDSIYIKIPVDSSTIVQIQYFPLNTSPIPGNRSVVGLDSKYVFGKLGSFTFESALSGLSVSNTNINGHAFLARADLTPLKNFHATLTLKDVNPTFSAIQSPGFNQNEKSAELNADYAATKRLKLTFDVERADRPSYSGDSSYTVNTVGDDTFNQYTVGANYTLSKNSSLAFTRSDVATVFAVGGNSTNTSDALSFSQTINKIGIDLSLNDNLSNVKSTSALLGGTTGATPTIYTSDSSSYGARLGLRWQANKVLNFTTSASANKILSNSDGSVSGSTAKDAQLAASFTGLKRVRANISVDYSDTGSTAVSTSGVGTTITPVAVTTPATSSKMVGAAMRSMLVEMQRDIATGSTGSTGTTSTLTTAGGLFGGGINSNLGGFGNQNNVINNSFGYTSFGGSSLSERLQLEVTPRKDLQLGLNLSRSSSLGDYQYNSDSTGLGLNANWQLSDRIQLTGTYNVQSLKYTGNFGSTSNQSAMLSFQGRPFGGKLGMQFGFQMMRTNSAFNSASTTSGDATGSLTNTSNDLTSVSARLDYPLNRKETLFVEWLDSITAGYLGNTEDDLRFGMDYALTRVLKFSLGWQILTHTYDDPTNSSLNYKASNILAQFGVRF